MKTTETINLYFLKLYTQMMYRKSGQGALEYIGIVVGLVVLIALGFQVAGVNIFKKASTFVQEVIDAGTPDGAPGGP